MQTVAVIGAAAVGDYIFAVERLPEKGEIVRVTSGESALTPGGCAPNIAWDIASLGKVQPVLYYPVGEDFAALGLEARWRGRGIACRLRAVPGAASGKAWLYMQPDGTTMCFSLPGAAAQAAADPGTIEEDWVVISPLLNDFTRPYAAAAAAQGKRLVLTGIGGEAAAPYLGMAACVFVNRCEAQALCAAVGCADEAALSRRWPDLTLFVTYGAEGSAVWRGGEAERVPVVRAQQALDSTGAGDAYTAGAVSAMAAGYDAGRAAWIGAACASFVLEQFGGQQAEPSWDGVLRRLAEQFPEQTFCIRK